MRVLIVVTSAVIVMSALTLLIAFVLVGFAHLLFKSSQESSIPSLISHPLPLWSLFPSLILAYAATLVIAWRIARGRRLRRQNAK